MWEVILEETWIRYEELNLGEVTEVYKTGVKLHFALTDSILLC
jgi:hypothetical protein